MFSLVANTIQKHRWFFNCKCTSEVRHSTHLYARSLEKVLINKCVELYKGVIAERIRIEAEKPDRNIDYGVPPQYMFIRMFDAVRKTEHFYKRTFVKAWMYMDDTLEPRTEDESSEEDMVISGMYYKRATGGFYWDLDRMKAFVDMTYDPRYGRGYSYDIRASQDSISLENEKNLWVS